MNTGDTKTIFAIIPRFVQVASGKIELRFGKMVCVKGHDYCIYLPEDKFFLMKLKGYFVHPESYYHNLYYYANGAYEKLNDG